MNSHNLDEIQPIKSDRELLVVQQTVFMTIDSEKAQKAQQVEFGPYCKLLSDTKKQPPSSETIST